MKVLSISIESSKFLKNDYLDILVDGSVDKVGQEKRTKIIAIVKAEYSSHTTTDLRSKENQKSILSFKIDPSKTLDTKGLGKKINEILA